MYLFIQGQVGAQIFATGAGWASIKDMVEECGLDESDLDGWWVVVDEDSYKTTMSVADDIQLRDIYEQSEKGSISGICISGDHTNRQYVNPFSLPARILNGVAYVTVDDMERGYA
jgi:hypothetical protein